MRNCTHIWGIFIWKCTHIYGKYAWSEPMLRNFEHYEVTHFRGTSPSTRSTGGDVALIKSSLYRVGQVNALLPFWHDCYDSETCPDSGWLALHKTHPLCVARCHFHRQTSVSVHRKLVPFLLLLWVNVCARACVCASLRMWECAS